MATDEQWREWDFADRHYDWFGKQHFSFLRKMAKVHGIGKCDSIISEMKHEGGAVDIPKEARVKWFTKVLNGKPLQ